MSYYILKALAAANLVWDLHSPPRHVVRSEQRLRRAVVERAAGQLAASFQVEQIAAQLHAMLSEKRASLNASIDELQDDFAEIVESLRHKYDEKIEAARHELHEAMRSVNLGAMPTMADLGARADAMFVRNPSMSDIVERARQILIDDVFEALLRQEAVAVAARP